MGNTDISNLQPTSIASDGQCAVKKSGRVAVIALAALAALAAVLFLPTHGDVFFTVLDDSAQCVLARGLSLGMPLSYSDDAFIAVPEAARPAILQRPESFRMTRDTAHRIDKDTFIARTFFQPFLPIQRAFLPGLPAVLALAILACMALWAAPRKTFGALLPAAVLACATALLTPWPARFCLSPFSEGVATLFAALSLSLSFRTPPRDNAGCMAIGAA